MTSPRKRIIIKSPGGRKALLFDETPIRDPESDEVQVDIKACGINFADIAVRLGLYEAAKGMYPLCPGLEFSGIVSRTGAEVDGYQIGEEVFGAARFGAYASIINCPPEHLWKTPPDWDFSRAAAFPVSYLTAYYGLHSVGNLAKADRALVHSAAGGVGTALIHLLKANGNMCVGVVGLSEKISAVKKAGADFVIDKSRENLWKRAEKIIPEGYDIILDANGASTLKGSYNHMRPAGRLIVYGFSSMFSSSGHKNWPKLIKDYIRTPRFNPFELTGSNKTVSGFNLIYLFEKVDLFRSIMSTLTENTFRESIPAMPVTEYAFEDVAQAHRDLESGKTTGKLVLVV
jgi:NADPH:quinone reductase-like Zn-dependent oxidoreductase